MRKNRVSSANLSNLPALRHGLAKEDFQSERKTPVLSVQGGLVLNGSASLIVKWLNGCAKRRSRIEEQGAMSEKATNS